jgi:hypothetical protein
MEKRIQPNEVCVDKSDCMQQKLEKGGSKTADLTKDTIRKQSAKKQS